MIEIRAMTEADAPWIVEMMRVFYASPAVFTNGSDEIFQNDVAACIGNSPYAEGFCFEVDGVLAGYGMIAKSFSTEFGKPCIWIEDIYLLPEYRGRGVGSRFIQTLVRDHPESILRLEVERENERALAVYQKNGMTELPYLEMILK